MADLTLPLSVEYETTVETFEVQMELLQPRLVKNTLRSFMPWFAIVMSLAPALIVLVIFNGVIKSLNLGPGVRAQVEEHKFFYGFVVCLPILLNLRGIWRISRGSHSVMARVKEKLRPYVGRTVCLDFTAAGMTKHDRGVQSLAPWSAMKSCCLFKDVLFLELANETWIAIPAATLRPAFATIEAIQQILLEHGVSERPVPGHETMA